LETATAVQITTQEAEVTTNNYPAYSTRARTEIYVPPTIQVDIAIVIDVTGSMQGEIDGVKPAVKKFIADIDPSTSPLTALIVFKDEVTVNAFTKDLTVLLKALNRLKAEGGGTGPEASVEAVLKAAPQVKAGGKMLFVTDASPYPDADVAAVSQLLKSQKIIFNAVLTGDCSEEGSWNPVK